MAKVSSGLILNFLAHSACNSAKLKSIGGFFFSTFFSIFFTTAFSHIFSSSINLAASSFLRKPLSLYNIGLAKYLEPSTAFHSAVNSVLSLFNPAKILKKGVSVKSLISRSLFTIIPSTQVITLPTATGFHDLVPAASFKSLPY